MPKSVVDVYTLDPSELKNVKYNVALNKKAYADLYLSMDVVKKSSKLKYAIIPS